MNTSIDSSPMTGTSYNCDQMKNIISTQFHMNSKFILFILTISQSYLETIHRSSHPSIVGVIKTGNVNKSYNRFDVFLYPIS